MTKFWNTYRETIIYAAVVIGIDGNSKCSYNYYNLPV